jgi:hypothetical protein
MNEGHATIHRPGRFRVQAVDVRRGRVGAAETFARLRGLTPVVHTRA